MYLLVSFMSFVSDLLPALSIQERYQSISPRTAFDEDSKLYESWAKDSPFDDPELFRLRCEGIGLCLDKFRRALSSRLGPDDAKQNTDWIHSLEKIILQYSGCEKSWSWQGEWVEEGRLIDFLRPIFVFALAQVTSHLDQIDEDATIFQRSTFRSSFLESLSKDIFDTVDRSRVLDMHLLRKSGALKGNTPAERFSNFVDSYQGTEYTLDFFSRFPVLARLVYQITTNAVEGTKALIESTFADRIALARFAEVDSFVVKSIHPSGDRHDGYCVTVLEFTNGKRVVYKPRSLDLADSFRDLIDWFNGLDSSHGLRAPRVLNRGNYGWTEFVEHSACVSIEEVREFYVAQGQLLALLYTIRAMDMHDDNLVACGSVPVIVDAETLLRPGFPFVNEAEREGTHPAYSELATDGVLATGMLPAVVRSKERSSSFHIGGIATLQQERAGLKSRRWVNVGLDSMSVERVEFSVPKKKNVPTVDGEAQYVGAFVDELLMGFEDAYRRISHKKAELTCSGGPLDLDEPKPVRVILRETLKYAMLHLESTHPSLVRDWAVRERYFDRLWVAAREYEGIRPAVPFEHDALCAGDIPRFESLTTSRDLLTREGPIKDFFRCSANEALMERLDSLSEQDLSLQKWLIHSALSVSCYNVTLKGLEPKRISMGARIPGLKRSTPASLEAHAVDAANLIVKSLFETRGGLTFYNISPNLDGSFEIRTAGLDLYDGIPGVLLFLKFVSRLKPGFDHKKVATGLLNRARLLMRSPDHGLGAGGGNGVGGLVYVFTTLAKSFDDADYISLARESACSIRSLIGADDMLDILGGGAGAIVPLLRLSEVTSDPLFLDIAEECAHHVCTKVPVLLEQIEELSKDQYTAFTGFSHGASGILWALRQLHELRPSEQYYRLYKRLLEYEHRFFSEKDSNWRDRRWSEGAEVEQFSDQWCHGSAGIALSRLDLLHLGYEDEDDSLLRDANAGTKSTLKSGFGHNHCLCHGDFGNLEVLRLAKDVDLLPQGRFEEQLERSFEMVHERGLLSGTPMRIMHPGLFTGLAGAGVGLLRASDEALVPNPLLFKI